MNPADNHVRPFGCNLRRLRLNSGLSISQLAVKTDLSSMTVEGYELGYRTPHLDTLRRLAKALGCTVVDLLEGE